MTCREDIQYGRRQAYLVIIGGIPGGEVGFAPQSAVEDLRGYADAVNVAEKCV